MADWTVAVRLRRLRRTAAMPIRRESAAMVLQAAPLAVYCPQRRPSSSSNFAILMNERPMSPSTLPTSSRRFTRCSAWRARSRVSFAGSREASRTAVPIADRYWDSKLRNRQDPVLASPHLPCSVSQLDLKLHHLVIFLLQAHKHEGDYSARRILTRAKTSEARATSATHRTVP